MLRRQLSKIAKTAIVILFYFGAYVVISILLTPLPIYNFVSDDFRVGDKYVLIYLIGSAPVFSDVVGADIFRSRRCGACFITNNKGFLPMSEYDAVVVHGDASMLKEAAAIMEPYKRFLLETDKECLDRRLMGCDGEVKFTSFATRETFDFCSLCSHLQEKRRRARGS